MYICIPANANELKLCISNVLTLSYYKVRERGLADAYSLLLSNDAHSYFTDYVFFGFIYVSISWSSKGHFEIYK